MLKQACNSNLCPLCRTELIEKEPTNVSETISGVPGIESIISGLLNPINNLPEITQTVSIAQELPIAMRTRSRRRIDVTERNDTVNNSVNTNTMFSDMVISQSLNIINNINNSPEMINELNTLIGNSLMSGDMNNFSEQMRNVINSNF